MKKLHNLHNSGVFIAFLGLVFIVYACKKDEPAPLSITDFSPKIGVANTPVIIRGVGFSINAADNIVKVGGVQAVLGTATESQLDIILPTNAKTGKITVEVGKRSASSTDDFVVPDGPTPLSFAPESAEEGQEVTIRGFNLGNNVIVKFNGIKAEGIIMASSTQLTVIVPDDATTGKITLEANGKSNVTTKDFTVLYPLAAKATVAKLAAVPAYPTAGADGVRIANFDGKSLLISGPGQNTVYKFDLNTFGVAPLINNISSPVAIGTDSDAQMIDANGTIHLYRFNLLTKSTALAGSSMAFRRLYNLKKSTSTHSAYGLIGVDFNNEIFGFTWGSAGGNTASTFKATKLNSQLKGIPNDASTMMATNSKSIFLFANHTLWKLEANNTLKQIAGSPGQKGYLDAKGANARFEDGGYARGNAISVDEQDNVYVADYGCGCIRKVDTDGNVTTVAGSKTASKYIGKGHRMKFRFNSWDTWLSPAGELYVIATNDVSSQTNRNALYKVTFEK